MPPKPAIGCKGHRGQSCGPSEVSSPWRCLRAPRRKLATLYCRRRWSRSLPQATMLPWRGNPRPTRWIGTSASATIFGPVSSITTRSNGDMMERRPTRQRHRAGWPPAPQSTPPYPYTEWPYGGATSIGVTRPNSVDSPLMVALANTEFGKALNAAHVQIYGWINVGGNVSTNTVKPGGNWPAAYMYTPNTAQLDQAVVYFERLPDTVQTDHIDWGFRVSALYGENYRYTTAYGLASYQLLNHNLVNGYDLPMVYGEVYVPWAADGLLLRFGRFISLPDIEAQLAPNNLMYSHSLAYTFDNYTNTGLQAPRTGSCSWASPSAPKRCRGTSARQFPTLSRIRYSRAPPCSRIPVPSPPSPPASAGKAIAATTTSTSWPTPSTTAPGATTICNGTESLGTTSSMTSGISPGRTTSSGRGTC